MIDIDQELKKYGLDREKYELCLKDIKDKINGSNDMDWAEIVAKYEIDCHSDTLRKASQTIFGGKFVADYFAEKKSVDNAGEGYLAQLRLEKEEVRRERQKLSDEKLEYNRWLREQARDELICEKICGAVRELEPLPLPSPIPYNHQETVGVLCFGDTHYGTEFTIKGLYGDVVNAYSPEIFEQRMDELLAQTIAKVQREGFTKIKVYSLGDELDGCLRASQLMKLRYGVVEATIKYADYICRWLAKLTEYVCVDFQMVGGNHTELRMLNQPKGTFKDDNMSEIIRNFIKTRLQDNQNFKMGENTSGLIYDEVMGYSVLAIHGEVKNLATAIHNFGNLYHTNIDILIGGHMHHSHTETVGVNRDVISIPSVIGIDDYSVQLGKASNAGATFLLIESGKGIVEQTTFKFSI